MKTLLQIRDMDIAHKDGILCRGVSFDICQGDCVMLSGPNGSGKTTLLRQLSLLKTISGGDVIMVPSRIPKVKGFTLRNFVRMSCKDEALVDGVIRKMGIEGLSDRDVSLLSDGEFQKAVIASALGRKADVLLLDEPTAFLDVDNKKSVFNMLRSICDSEKPAPAVVFSTHDIYDGGGVASKVITLSNEGKFYCTIQR